MRWASRITCIRRTSNSAAWSEQTFNWSTVTMDSKILDSTSCSYTDLFPLGISELRNQYSWKVVGVKFWSLKAFKIFNDVFGPSSWRPPPWGVPSTISATPPLKSRLRTPWASNLMGRMRKSSSWYPAASCWFTFLTKQPSTPPKRSGTTPWFPNTTEPTGKAAGSMHTMSPFFRPPAVSTQTHTCVWGTAAPGAAGGIGATAGTTGAAIPNTPGGCGGGKGATGATTPTAAGAPAGAKGGSPRETRIALASTLACRTSPAKKAGSNGAKPYTAAAGMCPGMLGLSPRNSKPT